MLTAAQLDRARGVLVGLAAGDALGAPYEFGPARGPELPIGGDDRFQRRVREARGQWPPSEPADVDLSSTRGLIRTLGERNDLITMFIEGIDPDVCYVGRPHHVAGSTFDLIEVDTQAEWSGRSRWRSKMVSRIDVGDSYARALAEFAGPRPPTAQLRRLRGLHRV